MKKDPLNGYSIYTPAAVLKVTGEDALAFLQGQFTQELRFPAGQLSAYGLWLNQKGKVMGDSFALREGDTWWLVSLHTPVTMLQARLEAYIIADDVVLEDETAAWQGIALLGSEASTALRSKDGILPANGTWGRSDGGFLFSGRRVRGESWEWLIPRGASLPPAITLANLPQIDSGALERLRVAGAIARIPDELGPSDLPNEAGLEEEAISYSKGCYLGQEVMARLKSMGQVRRRLLPVRGTGAVPVCPAALFFGAKKSGELRSAIPSAEGEGFVGMAMVNLIGLDREKPFSLEPEGAPRVRIDGV